MRSFQEIILGLGALITTLGILIKIFNNFFLEMMKSKYKDVPGKQSMYELCVVWIMISIFIMSIILTVYNISSKFISKTDMKITIYELVIAIIVIIIIVFWGVTLNKLINIYIQVKVAFKQCLEDVVCKVEIEKLRNYKKDLWIIIVISCLYSVLWIFTIVTSSKALIMAVGIFGISGIGVFIIAFNLKNAIQEIIDEKQYMLYTLNNEIICCRCYLEYNEYYLVFKNGVETYILKSDIKKRRIIRGQKTINY